ncbi:BarA-associated response regulator UvrY (= GacA = SirA) [Citrobacter freundii]|uniref:BarA-associated response regulator UvrY (= GacA = SirA) n=1 Tax=Citrobacter freundii TaxID=546 RepID=A0A7G2ITT7_CITFR|nr:BarA-associated response regulator UvrY (= GacA = SirA) [Citrobacter freundii]
MINVFLVDDHELVRAGIRRILEDIKGIKVVGEACCGEDAVKWCRSNSVDVVLMDMNMPGIGGLEATRKIARSTADIKVIMLTVHTENPLPAKVMQAGAAGYLSKGAAPQEVVSAIRSVFPGNGTLPPISLSKWRSARLSLRKRKPRLPVCLNASCRLC